MTSPSRFFWLHKLLLCGFILGWGLVLQGNALQLGKPLKTEILDEEDKPVARALIYIDYFEVLTLDSQLLGKVGIVNVDGIFQLFLVTADNERTLVGWGANRQLYNSEDRLIGFYDWSTFWVYAYSETGKKLGRAKCIAFRGYCAAGVAAYLTGLFGK